MGIAFTVGALWHTWDRSRDTLLPDPATLLIAAGLVIAGLVAAGRSWVALFVAAPTWRMFSDFFLAQLAKYIPGGGVWQMTGQVWMTTASGYTATRASGNLVIHALIQLLAGTALGGLLVLDSKLPTWIRAGAAVGLLSPILLHRSWMSVVLRRLGALLKLDFDELTPPAQGAIVRSWMWAVAGLFAIGLAYSVIVHALDASVNLLYSTFAFSLAWAIGFALVPFPAGLGVREAALIVLGTGSASVALAASIAVRLLAITAELTLALVTRARRP